MSALLQFILCSRYEYYISQHGLKMSRYLETLSFFQACLLGFSENEFHSSLSRFIHLVGVSLCLQGPIMNCTRLAEKAVALVCCEKLHKIGKR